MYICIHIFIHVYVYATKRVEIVFTKTIVII